mmetsp:Transcript_24083/g.90876  ORF Transcript_24083/g.90876 Transcript_24083/m.90876 type:complete len:239 (+) Transcript_24083:461-1177(+)
MSVAVPRPDATAAAARRACRLFMRCSGRSASTTSPRRHRPTTKTTLKIWSASSAKQMMPICAETSERFVPYATSSRRAVAMHVATAVHRFRMLDKMSSSTNRFRCRSETTAAWVHHTTAPRPKQMNPSDPLAMSSATRGAPARESEYSARWLYCVLAMRPMSIARKPTTPSVHTLRPSTLCSSASGSRPSASKAAGWLVGFTPSSRVRARIWAAARAMRSRLLPGSLAAQRQGNWPDD